ncbi:U3 small nucleolar ribonucleoprotein mpp10 [Hypsizygus marmoreus]|uniref:U3 small nucleolar ribonucleoprotein protein MPP10 n=1 Tax=Hypsizygus marmoreus TaxID=39966 RepID=A0A369KDG3_HYPMA|nr:U3 small nucleolar ribonucleoprotein mpp10 [Hypsizygus marmoreus]
MASPESREVFPELQTLSNAIETKLETFASGSEAIRAASLNVAKFLFDLSIESEQKSAPYINELVSSLEPSYAPATRSQGTSGKRKRTSSPSPPPKPSFAPTPIPTLFIDGMDEDQIWAQLDLRAKNVCDTLEHVLEGEAEEEDLENEDGDSEEDERMKKALETMANGEEIDFDAFGDDMDVDALLDEEESADDSDEGVYDDEESEGAEELGEVVTGLRDSSPVQERDLDGSLNLLDAIRKQKPTRRKSKGHAELDDGFFDLASFNAETERAEARSSSRGRLGDEEDSDSDISVDLFAALGEKFEEDDLENDPGEAMYNDFFEPPPRVVDTRTSKGRPSKPPGQVRFHEEVRVKKIRAKGKNLPLSSMDDEDEDENKDADDDYDDPELEGDDLDSDDDHDAVGLDGEDRLRRAGKSRGGLSHSRFRDRQSDDGEDDNDEHDDDDDGPTRTTMERLKDDLFAEIDDGLHQDLSTHEKRLAELREQITQLESENVGPKDWVLMGEAGSRTRPQNSLLEEDLEFERAMKAVPVITEEIVLVLEERIKARILEGRFDDVVRIRPVDDKPFLPSRFFELKDTKSTQSLAQIYESDFIATQASGVAGDDRDGKLKKEHGDIEAIWESLCGKLDALCNAHFMPKQPKATISTISNISTAILESALPTTKSVTTMLAPEEVFAPLATEPLARSEMTPAQKRALRGKERKVKKKSRDTLNTSVDKYAKVRGIGGVKKQKQAALESVVKSGTGVTIVGKKGKELRKGRSRLSTTT